MHPILMSLSMKFSHQFVDSSSMASGISHDMSDNEYDDNQAVSPAFGKVRGISFVLTLSSSSESVCLTHSDFMEARTITNADSCISTARKSSIIVATLRLASSERFVAKSLRTEGKVQRAFMSRRHRTVSRQGNTRKRNRHRPNECRVSMKSIWKTHNRSC